ncbi:Uncharacterized protein APZ42_018981 [Daphnia magna]|uniref:Uncharacterized protein n=1 Tax=Daphnia magna TaxID=35525 RepID=A0A164YYM6_9CRUS|nr:Uncharacterized protein APZ42_018981 [Daphnia magna]
MKGVRNNNTSTREKERPGAFKRSKPGQL